MVCRHFFTGQSSPKLRVLIMFVIAVLLCLTLNQVVVSQAHSTKVIATVFDQSQPLPTNQQANFVLAELVEKLEGHRHRSGDENSESDKPTAEGSPEVVAIERSKDKKDGIDSASTTVADSSVNVAKIDDQLKGLDNNDIEKDIRTLQQSPFAVPSLGGFPQGHPMFARYPFLPKFPMPMMGMGGPVPPYPMPFGGVNLIPPQMQYPDPSTMNLGQAAPGPISSPTDSPSPASLPPMFSPYGSYPQLFNPSLAYSKQQVAGKDDKNASVSEELLPPKDSMQDLRAIYKHNLELERKHVVSWYQQFRPSAARSVDRYFENLQKFYDSHFDIANDQWANHFAQDVMLTAKHSIKHSHLPFPLPTGLIPAHVRGFDPFFLSYPSKRPPMSGGTVQPLSNAAIPLPPAIPNSMSTDPAAPALPGIPAPPSPVTAPVSSYEDPLLDV